MRKHTKLGLDGTDIFTIALRQRAGRPGSASALSAVQLANAAEQRRLMGKPHPFLDQRDGDFWRAEAARNFIRRARAYRVQGEWA